MLLVPATIGFIWIEKSMGPLMFLLREKRRRIGCLGLFVSLMGFIMCLLGRDRYIEVGALR